MLPTVGEVVASTAGESGDVFDLGVNLFLDSLKAQNPRVDQRTKQGP